MRGGSHAVLVNPSTCGTNTVSGLLTPWRGAPDYAATTTFTTSYDGAGGPCPAVTPFAPTLAVTATPTTAGANTSLDTRVDLPDRNADLGALAISLPPGLIGSQSIHWVEDDCLDAGLAGVAVAVVEQRVEETLRLA